MQQTMSKMTSLQRRLPVRMRLAEIMLLLLVLLFGVLLFWVSQFVDVLMVWWLGVLVVRCFAVSRLDLSVL